MGSFFSIALTLFFIMDAVGILPIYLKLVAHHTLRQKKIIAIREQVIALIVMVVFYFIGDLLLPSLSISNSALKVSGGIIFFLIAIRLIFRADEDPRGKWETPNPFIVPIAIPLIAGPSLLAALMIYSQEETMMSVVFLALFIAWILSTLIFLFAEPIFLRIGEKGLMAFERFMGLILALVAIQWIITGIKALTSTPKL